jgi:hypothetical protein
MTIGLIDLKGRENGKKNSKIIVLNLFYRPRRLRLLSWKCSDQPGVNILKLFFTSPLTVGPK